MRISDWSSDVCSSDLLLDHAFVSVAQATVQPLDLILVVCRAGGIEFGHWSKTVLDVADALGDVQARSEEHTSELQSLMRISYAVFCLKKKKNTIHNSEKTITTNTISHQQKHIESTLRCRPHIQWQRIEPLTSI